MRLGTVVAAVYLACASLAEASLLRAPVHALSKTAGGSPVRKLQLHDFQVFKQINNTSNAESGSDAKRSKRRPVPVGSILPGGKEQEFAKQIEKERRSNENNSSTEIWDWDELTYTTSISLGSPPQAFDPILSISSGELFVRSGVCEKPCPPGSRYSAAASRTSTPHDEFISSDSPRFLADGQLAEDTLQLAGIDIENQQFGAANGAANVAIETGTGSGREGWDGILGLAPGARGSWNGTANPFMNMMTRKKLDWNLFSLKMPRGQNEPGEIMFGGVDEALYYGSLKKLPLVPYLPGNSDINDRWAVPASGIGIGDGYASLYGYTAVIESDFPSIALPHHYTTLLNMYLGMEALPGNTIIPPSIDCEKRERFQNLTISLAEQRFVLSPWDYTIEIDLGSVGGEKGVKRCVSAFTSTGDSWEHQVIVLGTPFLRNFYGVFDADGKTISFGKLKTPNKEGSRKGNSELKELRR